MELVIHSMACISHYATTNEDFFFEDSAALPSSKFLRLTPPAYKDHIPAPALRRMSAILKMGVGAGLMCLKKAGLEKPDAIITGTAMGCFEDTDKFLRPLLDNQEQLPSPTPFIQSTHNTISGQLALLSQCHGYNMTYAHQNLAFEFALQDAGMLLQEDAAGTVLTGSADELNPALAELFERAGHIKTSEHLGEHVWNNSSKGYTAGEGAAFFLLGKQASAGSVARISGVKTLHQPSHVQELEHQLHTFLSETNLSLGQISLVMSGSSGSAKHDLLLNELTKNSRRPTGYFKHLCGEYFTSSGFALWLAASMLKKQHVPAVVMPDGAATPKTLQHILIVNQYHAAHYSFICVSAC